MRSNSVCSRTEWPARTDPGPTSPTENCTFIKVLKPHVDRLVRFPQGFHRVYRAECPRLQTRRISYDGSRWTLQSRKIHSSHITGRESIDN